MVEDDEKIFEIVKANIAELGFELDWAENGSKGLEMALSEDYSLILLDLMLPELGGKEVCRKLREAERTVPIIILTARNNEIDRVLGLELGADDYLAKPFSVPELLARIRAVLRRDQWSGAERRKIHSGQDTSTIVSGELSIDPILRKVTLSGEVVPLSVMEFDLLLFLAQHPGRPFTRAQLLQSVWGHDLGVYESNVNGQINRLRRKIEADPSDPKYVLTVWGLGYRFVENENDK